MIQKIHTFSLGLNMRLMSEISKVDRFDASWAFIEKREGQTLKHLKEIATVRSVGASTRIEGSKMSDAEVEAFISKLRMSKLEERDEQEVAGYFEALDTISESYKDIEITEGNLKNLHNILMKHCEKDAWHRGNYKQTSNAVEAKYPDGTSRIIFKTAEPGFDTEDAMKKLIEWYHGDKETVSIVKAALFVYDFLSIHPFQDGNGRLSRLLGSLLMLKHGYSWIQYVSLEHEIEDRKAEYYNVLMQTQKQRPGENLDEWIIFFMDCLLNIQEQLMEKLKTKTRDSHLSLKEKNILAFIENHPRCQSGEIAEKLNIPLPTVKRILSSMVKNNMILKYGAGAGINYLAEKGTALKAGRMFQLTNAEKKKKFNLLNSNSFIDIKKIILTPLFSWTKPDEWSAKLSQQGLGFKIICHTNRGGSFSQPFYFTSLISLFHYQPVIELMPPINIPDFMDKSPAMNEFPLRVEIELLSSVSNFDFDVMFVFDEAG